MGVHARILRLRPLERNAGAGASAPGQPALTAPERTWVGTSGRAAGGERAAKAAADSR